MAVLLPSVAKSTDEDRSSQVNGQTCVDHIRTYVRDAAVEDVVRMLQRPSGRRPDEASRTLSTWFHALSDEDRSRLREVIQLASHAAVFGFLTSLDGTRRICDEVPPGRFELRLVGVDRDQLLNDPIACALHELL